MIPPRYVQRFGLLLIFVLTPEAQPLLAQERGPALLAQATARERLLMERIEKLEARIVALESRLGPPMETRAVTASGAGAPAGGATQAAAGREFPRQEPLSSLPSGTSLNFYFDGYYGYNFNRPLGRVNVLRASDVLSSSFSLNQTGFVVERPPDVNAGRRYGFRLDLMYGQATETLQGSPANESRPQVYRPIFQAFGTYVVSLGSGLTIDFGKWASPLGIENNYAKDQLNYSRSYFFSFLPFYHFGFRATYPVSQKVSLSYWLTNGNNQSEDFNAYKSQVFSVTAKPSNALVWTINYAVGREQRDLTPLLNPGFPLLPIQPGFSTTQVLPALRGRSHILDSYATWTVSRRLLFAGEFDAVWNRVQTFSPPARVIGAAAYARFAVTSKFSLLGRTEYLSDRGGLFSGVTQALKETTFTATYSLGDGLQTRLEWRRDFSNRPFFLTSTAGAFKGEQSTATLGLLWWLGSKKGPW